jgi:hypothetical protein
MSRKVAELLAETDPIKERNIISRAEHENLLMSYKEVRSRDSSVSIAAGHGMDGWSSILSWG